MKKLLYISLLLLPLITQGQTTAVTMQFRRNNTQVDDKDSLIYTFPGIMPNTPTGYRTLWNAAKIRDYINLNYVPINGNSTINGIKTFTGSIQSNGTINFAGNNTLSAPGAWLFNSDNDYEFSRQGLGVVFRIGVNSGANYNETALEFRYNGDFSTSGKLHNNWIPDWGSVKSRIDSAIIAGTINPDSVLHPNKNLYDIPNKATTRTNLVVYSKSEIDTKVQLKQPRIISALPTQTSGRPIVGDSVNAAIAKERFRSDSIASAIGTRILKSGDTMTGTLNSQSLIPTTTNIYGAGDATHIYANGYFGATTTGIIRPLNTGGIAVQSSSGVGIAVLTNTGKLYLGANVTPTAQIHIQPGSSTAGTGPLKLSSGPLLATPEVGTEEFLTDRRYFTQTTGATRQTYAWLSDVNSLIDNILPKTADYTIVSGDFAAGKKTTLDLYVDATAGNVTITLPSASTFAGYTIYITKTDASVNTVTINTLLGGNTLITRYQSRQANSDTSSWYNH